MNDGINDAEFKKLLIALGPYLPRPRGTKEQQLREDLARLQLALGYDRTPPTRDELARLSRSAAETKSLLREGLEAHLGVLELQTCAKALHVLIAKLAELQNKRWPKSSVDERIELAVAQLEDWCIDHAVISSSPKIPHGPPGLRLRTKDQRWTSEFSRIAAHACVAIGIPTSASSRRKSRATT
jgi:hypothetical protein